MSLVALCVALTLGAAEPSIDAVLITRKTGVTPAQAAELQAQLARALEANQLKVKLSGVGLQSALKKLGVKDASACNGRRSCINELVRQLQATALVSVSVSRIDDETALALELVRLDERLSPVKDSLLLPPGKSALEPLVAAFATKVREALGADAPRVVEPPPAQPLAAPTLVPEPPPTPPPAVFIEAPAPSRAAPTVLAISGGVSLAAGVALLIVSVVTRGELNATTTHGGLPASSLTEDAAQRKNTESNVLLGTGLGAAVVGAGLATGAILTW